MKTLLLSFLLVASCTVYGQKSSNNQVDLKAVGKLMTKATPAQVKGLFGEATDEMVTPETHLLVYKNKADSSQALFRFDKTHQLHSFIFDDHKQKAANQLPYTNAKEARTLLSREAVADKLGYPTQVVIKDNQETWYYKFGNKKAGEKNIIIRYNMQQPQVVKSYHYYADLNKSIAFSSDIVTALTKGLTSLDEVEKTLGEPTKVIMGVTSESWYYLSGQSTLIVYFDAQSKVNDYLFTKQAKN